MNAAVPVGMSMQRILIAGVGNVFLHDDGFGPEVVRRLRERDLPDAVTVFDFGTGGLSLAHEMMCGYDALVLVDASRQGGQPGTLSLIEPSPYTIPEGIDDYEDLDPHATDPASVLRFVKAVAGWPSEVLVVTCEPEDLDDTGVGLSRAMDEAADRAVDMIVETIARLNGTFR